MTTLSERLEKAKGADRNLDRAIFDALGFEVHEFDPGDGDVSQWRQWADGTRVKDTHVTASIDAALALVERVLPGWTVQIFQLRRNKGWGARISSLRYDTFSSFEDDAHVSDDGFVGQSSGALALLVALLRARASLQDKGGTA